MYQFLFCLARRYEGGSKTTCGCISLPSKSPRYYKRSSWNGR